MIHKVKLWIVAVVAFLQASHALAAEQCELRPISLNNICHSIFGEAYSGAKTRSGGARVPLGIIAPKNAGSEVRTMVWQALKTKLTTEIFEKISGQ